MKSCYTLFSGRTTSYPGCSFSHCFKLAAVGAFGPESVLPVARSYTVIFCVGVFCEFCFVSLSTPCACFNIHASLQYTELALEGAPQTIQACVLLSADFRRSVSTFSGFLSVIAASEDLLFCLTSFPSFCFYKWMEIELVI